MTQLPAAAHRLMSQQHGVASAAQLVGTGLTNRQLQHLADTGQLIHLVRGAYASPSRAIDELTRCAALCLARRDVVVAGPTAGRLWSFRHVARDRRLHLIAPPRAQPCRDRGVAVYRTAAIHAEDIIARPDGIRVTSRPRTALDLSRHVGSHELLSIIEQAMLDGNHGDADMRRTAVDWISPQRRWLDVYLRQLDRRVPGKPAESKPEVDLGQALTEAGVQPLHRQFSIDLPGYGPARFDLAVPDISWAIEIDVHPSHETIGGTASDHRRDVGAVALGWLVTRVTRARYLGSFDEVVTDLTSIYRARTTAMR
jgi:hypothetical protein